MKEEKKVENAKDLRAQYFAERAKKRSSLLIPEGWGGSLQERIKQIPLPIKVVDVPEKK